MDKKRVYRIGLVCCILVVAYVVIAFFLTRHALDGTRVVSHNVGGMSYDEVVQTIKENAREDSFFVFADGDYGDTSVSAEDLGITVDADATARQVAGFTLNPVTIVKRIKATYDEGNVALIKRIDDEKFAQTSDRIAHELSRETINATVYFTPRGVHSSDNSEDGLEVDSAEVKKAILEAHAEGSTTLRVPTKMINADVSDAEASARAYEIDQGLGDKDVVLEAGGGKTLRIPVELIRRFGYFNDKLELCFRDEEFRNAVMDENPGVGDHIVNARFEFPDGKPVVKPAQDGVSVDSTELTRAVREAISSPDNTASVGVGDQRAQFSTKDAEAMKLPDVIAQFATDNPQNDERNARLEHVAKKISGTVVKPGETFDFNAAVGPYWAEPGYEPFPEPTVLGGVEDDSRSGPYSQLATTLFNAALEAGLEIREQHGGAQRPSVYPDGRDVIVNTRTNFVFANTTDKPIVIESFVNDNKTHVKIHGTKQFDVELSTTDRWNVTAGLPPKEESGSRCVSYPSLDGGSVLTYRVIKDRNKDQPATRDTFYREYSEQQGQTCSGKS
ncbi:vancomycin resistance protein YoaR [Brevibacterium paucivorans]|uniref:Vancomycin resistance protein YoaR n=1 Tax=Brevibacterium paucivorans TaxID=170994 RepID=A0ABS2SIN3_9MICO|nr:VanW family protein [Brevibacterium paucivorans]MBM7815620.1 vancomycin resistance protein YoaR [Brevibacterium paucivorans]